LEPAVEKTDHVSRVCWSKGRGESELGSDGHRRSTSITQNVVQQWNGVDFLGQVEEMEYRAGLDYTVLGGLKRAEEK
jgi:hypothetical protein